MEPGGNWSWGPPGKRSGPPPSPGLHWLSHGSWRSREPAWCGVRREGCGGVSGGRLASAGGLGSFLDLCLDLQDPEKGAACVQDSSFYLTSQV